ncbi:Os01g0210550 [Oryza sativa Japonica Group]|uniref:Os01g0210550 protein n=1 Tax=Oryza sativa subsp. japonica TaxID=39947 RepID=A0A0P0UZI9_ORYSJ|nr:hypothetical protein EE612_000999 [Oryza sativa]BAS70984.1 Os01g0210550 [Oryza sativa Japonica Group]
MSSMGAVEAHMASLYRRISNPLALSTTSYDGHSMRSHDGGTAAEATAAAARSSSIRPLRRAMVAGAGMRAAELGRWDCSGARVRAVGDRSIDRVG